MTGGARAQGVAAAALALVVAAGTGASVAQSTATRCDHCGTVGEIRRSIEKSTWTPLGSVSPGTVPGDSGNNAGRVTSSYVIGPQLKNQGMVLLGSAGGGAYVARPNSYERPRWEVVVAMDAGGTRVASLAYEPPFQRGDRVRIYGTQLELVSP